MAKGFADNGAKVYIGGRRKEIVDKIASEYSSALDVTDKASIESAVETISKADGKLDVLVNK
ncbi:hypothetical protein FRC09_002812 [Ceratobasidium sp. 395]|nr:hypothetical protein FRC09_002812 [Ceratobasidium sp. 395]